MQGIERQWKEAFGCSIAEGEASLTELQTEADDLNAELTKLTEKLKQDFPQLEG